MMRQVGTRKETPVQTQADGSGLVACAEFSMSIAELAGGSTFVPKGLYKFQTHEEAALNDEAWLAAGMARLALGRNHLEAGFPAHARVEGKAGGCTGQL